MTALFPGWHWKFWKVFWKLETQCFQFFVIYGSDVQPTVCGRDVWGSDQCLTFHSSSKWFFQVMRPPTRCRITCSIWSLTACLLLSAGSFVDLGVAQQCPCARFVWLVHVQWIHGAAFKVVPSSTFLFSLFPTYERATNQRETGSSVMLWDTSIYFAAMLWLHLSI